MDYPDSGIDLLSNSSSSDAEGDSWFQIFWYFVLFIVVIYLCKQGETALPCCAPMHVKCTTCRLYEHGIPCEWCRCRGTVLKQAPSALRSLAGKSRNAPRREGREQVPATCAEEYRVPQRRLPHFCCTALQLSCVHTRYSSICVPVLLASFRPAVFAEC